MPTRSLATFLLPLLLLRLVCCAVGGLGLNLTSADTVVFMEHDWNPMRDLQVGPSFSLFLFSRWFWGPLKIFYNRKVRQRSSWDTSRNPMRDLQVSPLFFLFFVFNGIEVPGSLLAQPSIRWVFL